MANSVGIDQNCSLKSYLTDLHCLLRHIRMQFQEMKDIVYFAKQQI